MFAFHCFNPGSGGCHFVKVEHARVQDLVEVHVAVVTFDDVCFGLDGADNLLDACQFFWFHFGCFVEQDDVTELNLLDDKVLDVLFSDVGFLKRCAGAELILHAESINHGDDAVEACQSVHPVFGFHGRDGADGLGDGGRFADARCLYDDVVKLSHLHEIGELFHEVHLQGAADATVLQGDERIVLLVHDAALLDEACIDVHLTDVVDDDGKLNALAVGEYAVEQRCLSTA